MNSTCQKSTSFDRSQWLKLIAINTLIAITLSLITKNSFWLNLLYSQSIGISVATAISILFLRRQDKEASIIWLAIAIVSGVLVGSTFATLVSGSYKTVTPEEGEWFLISSFFYSTIIGSVVAYYFFLVANQKEMSNQLTIEKLKQAEYEQALAENNLKILQAQIEPHFLFNTLSNVIGLIDQRPDDAKKMLEHFTHYLRSSLSRTRESDTTLEDEIAIINAYLSIQKIRMGKRLNYKIIIAEELTALPFPPLLIQPLVENSVRHGLEPEIGGGEISVEVKQKENTLIITVSDTGKGAENMQSDGIGLKNIRERLTSIFQNRAEIKIEPNSPKGLIVTLHTPLEKI
ncbi:MAG TPA: hypothetical protein ENJ07_02840 [Gammaproteobacteria bacterium]|nr:hypothetical protein [Gammaproteobacteria bacterium]